ncbi:hypothetical protein PSEUBRA_006227 [Kalmanozyma brasiliensis GHG001]|uniref:Uncharacterized protein n=1 Tax=Kalmanozyma brasiliensis (strain GHG001) TaxID=1365824 RepID=V5ERI7_KALBG|nr:uncharacterized protein PSEUBRA_006227 [Kalmanozyma brasiliensis GHG001]EST04489.1 hypothetical protein PSEUBRA_006227 [Kalmanozyma brasiliensis GHG001]
MITDLILLAVLFAIIGGIIKLVSFVAPPPPGTTKPSSATSGNSSAVKLGGSGTTLDWQHGQMNLKTNLRPVTQQDLLEKAEASGRDGGKFVTEHANSFSFGKKDASGL